MAATCHARFRVGHDRVLDRRRLVVRSDRLELPCSSMAVQAFAVAVALVEMDRVGNRSDILIVQMLQPAQLGVDIAIHCVLRVAGITCLVARDAVVLEMRRRHEYSRPLDAPTHVYTKVENLAASRGLA